MLNVTPKVTAPPRWSRVVPSIESTLVAGFFVLSACGSSGEPSPTDPGVDGGDRTHNVFGTESPSPTQTQPPSGEPGSLPLCFGYRGNGPNMFTTVGGIARMMEQYGEPDAVVGTSSGSVAAFLTESVLLHNPAYLQNGDGEALPPGQAVIERRSFMLKSLPLLAKAMISSETDLGRDVALDRQIFDLVMSFQSLLPERQETAGETEMGASRLRESVVEKAKALLTQKALTELRKHNPELSQLIHPAFYEIADDPARVETVVRNLLAFQGLADADGFKRQNVMHPGLVHFDRLFEIVGVVADWYAGYGPEYPRAELGALLDHCAADSIGLWWNALAERTLYDDVTCGEKYHTLFVRYFNDRLPGASQLESGFRRVNESIGAHVPTFVSTSAISGNAVVDAMNAAADAEQYDAIDALELSRDNFKVLYFGTERYTDLVAENRLGFEDVITTHTVAMGRIGWLEAMKASGQEPATGRANLYEKDGQRYLGIGGYVDQLPSKLMRNLGCGTTVAFNTNAPLYEFSKRFTPTLWEDEALVDDMVGPEPTSADRIAFEHTDALLCAHWAPYELSEIWEMADAAYHAKLFSLGPSTEHPIELVSAPPRACYEEEDSRGHRFEAYTLPRHLPKEFIQRREMLAADYPNITQASDAPENEQILCPFLRMLTRAGLFDADKPEDEQAPLMVGILKVARAAREFGCSWLGCGGVAGLVSAGQLVQGTSKPGKVNLESLHTGGLAAHECGLTFAFEGTQVDDRVRAKTLQRLLALADHDGRLSFQDLETVKLDICEAQGVKISRAGSVEIGLIYSFLGGNARGYIEYADVERFLHAQLPLTLGDPGAAK